MATRAPSGMAELQLQVVANLLTMPHVLMHLASLGTSGPGNATKGFFCDYICRCIHFHPIPFKACFITAGRQTTLLLSH